jgi:hypothetical protein
MLLDRPSGGLSGSITHGRSPGSQRIADAAFPDTIKVQWREASARRSQSRGRPRIGESLPCSLFILGQLEEPCFGLCPNFETGCQMERNALGPRCGAGNPRRPRLKSCVGAGSRHRKRLARTSAGNSASDFGGEPRGPNQVLSSHSAVILVSAKTGRRITAEFSPSAESVSTPNSASANRRSISCCNRARACRVAAHGGAV